jgi:hypothetical protein
MSSLIRPFQVECGIDDVTVETWKICIDLNNQKGKGPYFHNQFARGIRLVSCATIQGQVGTTDTWISQCGVIVALNNSRALVASPCPCSIITGPGKLYDHKEWYSPWGYDLLVKDGQAQNLVALTDSVTAIRANATLKDADDNDVLPEVGDIVCGVQKFAGAGTDAIVAFRCLQYVLI